MPQYDFHYPRLRSITIAHFLIAVLGFGLLIPGILSLQALSAAEGADKTVFAALGISLSLAGAGILFLVFIHFRMLRHFYAKGDWYGVRLDKEKIICRYFDYFKSRSWEISRAAVQKAEPGAYKGRRYIILYTPSGKYTIPLNNLDRNQEAGLLLDLRQIPPATQVPAETQCTFSDLQLRIVETMMQIIEKRFPVSFPRSYSVLGENLFGFGYQREKPDAPYIEVNITGGGAGDYYSGSVDYEDIFRLKNTFNPARNRVSLIYTRTATNIAGDCSTLQTSLEGTEGEALEDEFFAGINKTTPVRVFLMIK